jgi:hypothetical protein
MVTKKRKKNKHHLSKREKRTKTSLRKRRTPFQLKMTAGNTNWSA